MSTVAISSIRTKIVETARECLGTPYQHQARLPGIAIDCVGLLIHVHKTLGFSEAECQDYPRQPNGRLEKELAKAGYVQLEEDEKPEIGDVVVMFMTRSRRAQHVAILTEHGIIHTNADIRKVVEHGFVSPWPEKLLYYCRFPGVD